MPGEGSGRGRLAGGGGKGTPDGLGTGTASGRPAPEAGVSYEARGRVRSRLMLRRRFLLAVGVGVAGCNKGAAPHALDWPRKSAHRGIEFIELFPNNADESAPLVIAIHGRGDRPEHWVDTWRTFPAR